MKTSNRGSGGSHKQDFDIAVMTLLIVGTLMIPVQAAYGPCETTTTPTFLNTISCVSGGCTGLVDIVPEQKACGNSDESECTPLENDSRVTYSPKAVDQGAAAYAYCCGLDSACNICAATLGLYCAYTVGAAWLTCVIGAGCGSCSAFTGCDFCCYTTCEQDLSTRVATPGGTNC